MSPRPPRPRTLVARVVALAVTALVALGSGALVASTSGSASAAVYPKSPFAGRTLFVDPASNAARDAAALAANDPAASAALAKIARHSQADWFGDWNPVERVAADVSARVGQIAAVGAYPVVVAYAIPKRDCSSYSAGGASSPEAYRAWIRAFKAGIGTRKAAVILEPDALAQLDCLSAVDQQSRLGLLKDATQVLAAGGNVAVYLDAGNAGWIPPKVMADRLAKAGVSGARGFSLNVSGFGWTAEQIAYGRQIAPSIGWKRFVVDTSRNGLGPAVGIDEVWCNPPGRALGAVPGAATGDALVDAFLWVKRPGESDGTCHGGPPAGTWWPEQAVGLAQRAAW